MKFKFWGKLLTNNYRFKSDHTEYRRVYLLNIVLTTLIVVCSLFSFINIFVIKLYTAGFINLSASVFAALTLYLFHKTDNIKIATKLAVLILLGTLSAYLAVLKNQCYALYWIVAFPAVVYFLLGNKKARIISIIYSIYLLIFILYKYKSWEPAAFTVGSIINIAVATFTLILMISYFEQSRKEVASILEQKNKELEETVSNLKESKDQLRLILDSTAEAIYGVDLSGLCTFCNTSCIQLLGYNHQGELLGQNMHLKIHHTKRDGSINLPEECKIYLAFMKGTGTHVDDEVFWKSDGTSFDVEYFSYPQYKDGKIVGSVVSFTDISARKKEEERVKYLTFHDSLTRLYNRSYIDETLKKIDTPQNLPISIIFGDVNGLKLTNDIFGHAAGDMLLKKTAQIMKTVFDEKGIVARVGGDEFIILMPCTEAEKAKEMIEKVKNELSMVEIIAIKCSISMGCCSKTSVNEDIQSTLENAENEMYKEKTRNRKSVNLNTVTTIIETLHSKNPREKQHSLNVSEFCKKIGLAMKLTETEIKKLEEIGFFHDIGKIILDDTILYKAGELTAEEKKEIQQHSVIGYRILNIFDETLDLAEGVYAHHERWDGSGYPKGLKGEEIPLLARIISVAEAYDALTNQDSHKALTKAEALEKIKEYAGTRLDPEIADIFIALMSDE